MRIRLYTILLSFLLPLVCYAQQPEDNLPEAVQLARMNVITVGGGVPAPAAGGCTILNDDDLVDYYTSNSDDASTNVTDEVWVAQYITVTQNSTLTQYEVQAKYVGTPTLNCTIELYTDVGSEPGAAVSGTVSTRALNTLQDTQQAETFTLDGEPVVLTSTAYWVVFKGNGGGGAFTPYRDTSVTDKTAKRSQDTGDTWGTTYSNQAIRVIVRGCLP